MRSQFVDILIGESEDFDGLFGSATVDIEWSSPSPTDDGEIVVHVVKFSAFGIPASKRQLRIVTYRNCNGLEQVDSFALVNMDLGLAHPYVYIGGSTYAPLAKIKEIVNGWIANDWRSSICSGSKPSETIQNMLRVYLLGA